MSDLVGNPEDKFSRGMAHLGLVAREPSSGFQLDQGVMPESLPVLSTEPVLRKMAVN